jgi:hypothetical protein
VISWFSNFASSQNATCARYAEDLKALESQHSMRASKFADEEEEMANLAALNEQVDKDLERAIGVVEAGFLNP